MNTKYIHIGKSTILWEKTSFSRAFKFLKNNIWGIERSGFFSGREKWVKSFENQRV